MTEEEQHIIDVVELANDMGLEAPEEYYKEYERIVNKEAQNGQ